VSENKEKVMEEQKVWGLLVHGVVAPVAFKERSEAVSAIKAWKSRGWEFVDVVKLEEESA
jgi:hypothetical protein